MSCKWCDGGYFPAVNVNGVVIHRTPPTVVVGRVQDDNGLERFVPINPIYRDGIEICTKRGLCLVVRGK
jgi:hypothetical protein